ncbi:MAG: DUF3089 domain-containing protein [Candidatus Eremiobacterota bacterium]
MKKLFLKNLGPVIILVIFLNLAASCSDDSMKGITDTSIYSQSTNWLSLPSVIDKPVDVFYLYPTEWQKTDPNEPDICAIDNPTMIQGAKSAFARQATAFQNTANIYAPYYRQLALSTTMTSEEREQMVSGIPTTCATEAFDYYIKHYNNGRPFILAAHSQGANILSYMLAGYLKNNSSVYKRMIAAYVIGYYVTPDYLAKNPHLKFAEGPDDTGVIISYNTEAPDVDNSKNILYEGPGLVINPITWTRDETVATTAQGLGSFMPDPNGVFVQVPQYADARVDRGKGVLICTTADEDALYPVTAPLGRGIYHSFDYPFYYYNLQQNAADRTNNFLKNWPGANMK